MVCIHSKIMVKLQSKIEKYTNVSIAILLSSATSATFLNFCAWSAVSKDVLFLQRTLRGNQTKVNEFLQQTCHPPGGTQTLFIKLSLLEFPGKSHNFLQEVYIPPVLKSYSLPPTSNFYVQWSWWQGIKAVCLQKDQKISTGLKNSYFIAVCVTL